MIEESAEERRCKAGNHSFNKTLDSGLTMEKWLTLGFYTLFQGSIQTKGALQEHRLQFTLVTRLRRLVAIA